MVTVCQPYRPPFLTPGLTPPDPKQCQCVIHPAHGPFRLGPRNPPERCRAAPTRLILQMVPDHDDQRGAMTVCDEHLAIYKQQAREALRQRIVRILPLRRRG